ncbi:MAG TPA: sialate O-acetylesterase [Verrucomicrobiota bacterium]|nr:sialate O-acetylesterase [Verrucomicrobiota bacterium]HNU52973.1 sialate O-acetylesterase [Verrucomicrobiota bacterium]
MNTKLRSRLTGVLLMTGIAVLVAGAAEHKALPKEDVVEVPAIGPALCVANVFQSNMVLQRDKPLNLWGWAEPGEEITVSFAGEQARATAAADRTWELTLKPVPAHNAPQTMTIRGKNATLTLDNILVGDVWVLGGQSNMEFPISNVDDGDLEIASANFPQIRLLTLPAGKGFASVRSFERLHEWSDWSGRHFRKGDWDICSPETVTEFSAIGYVFGRRVHMASGVPIGLIDASIGGTTLETWTPEDVLRTIDGPETRAMLKDWADRIAAFDPQADLKARATAYENRMKTLQAKGEPIPADSKPPSDLRPGPVADRNRPGHCYAGVIRPLRGLAVAGALFHQGYNNAFNGSAGARMYYQVFAKMIAAWRETFGDPRMPFCILSLCTDGPPQTRENFLAPMYDAGIYIREAQYQTFCDLRRAGDKTIGFASSFDLRKAWYHPQIKIPVGERAAKWALAARYGLLKGREADAWWLPPTIEKVEIAGSTMRLTMSTDVKTRDDSDGRMLGFAIAGKDRRFYPAEVDWHTDAARDGGNRPQVDHSILVLRSRFVPEPLHYRYAWARNPMGNLVNPRGVPLAPQRSDDWILEETPVTITPPKQMTEDAAARYVANQLRKMLAQADLERRLKEAEATIAELKPVLEKTQAGEERKRSAD